MTAEGRQRHFADRLRTGAVGQLRSSALAVSISMKRTLELSFLGSGECGSHSFGPGLHTAPAQMEQTNNGDRPTAAGAYTSGCRRHGRQRP
jgi:hypothetical protein